MVMHVLCNTYFLVRAAYFDNYTNSTEVTLDMIYEHDWVVDGPEQVCDHTTS